MSDELAGAARAMTRRQRRGLVVLAFCDSLADWMRENASKPRRERERTFRGIRLALRAAREAWRGL
jgi:hypothetical protein